ncbi:MAG: hypothetical protein K2G04_07830 [Oscillospiraceae bacterium]|nr:hypothetical protein [Oscillospiraceae bacterium]
MQYAFVRTPCPYDTTTLNYNWQVLETKAFSLYTNATDTVDEKSAKLAVDAIIRFMAKQGVINTKISEGYRTEFLDEKNLVQIHSPAADFYRSFVETGDEFSKGEKLCEILDPLEWNVIVKVSAPCDGIVFSDITVHLGLKILCSIRTNVKIPHQVCAVFLMYAYFLFKAFDMRSPVH